MFWNIIFFLEQMIQGYLQQLRTLQEDRSQFQSNANKTVIAKSLSEQEDKYQAYIIDQMSSQNRIVAASHMADTLGKSTRIISSYFFKKIMKISGMSFCQESSTSICRVKKNTEESISHSDSMSVDLLLVKMCSNVMCRYVDKMDKMVKKNVFNGIVEYSRKKERIENIEGVFQKYVKRHAFQGIRNAERKHVESEDRLFSDSFSIIARQDRNRKTNIEESYLSFMFQKENNNLECHQCRDSCQLLMQKEKQNAKCKEQLSYLKHLLTEKSLELKKKQEEIENLRVRSIEDSQQSVLSSHNSSYYSQMERQVLGGKRIRKNGSIRKSQTGIPKEELSKQLLGKYMRQSFQLKESMDVARELCLDFQHKIPPNCHNLLFQILKVLNQGEEVSLVDQY